MPTYILLSTVSAAGTRALRRNPSRLQVVNAEVEKLGARVVGQWAVLGEYDFVTVVEAPDDATVTAISVELAARGSTKVRTLPAVPVDVFLERLSPEDPEP